MFGKYPRRTVVGAVDATAPPLELAAVTVGLLSLPQAATATAITTKTDKRRDEDDDGPPGGSPLIVSL